jgi:hypothetical protein
MKLRFLFRMVLLATLMMPLFVHAQEGDYRPHLLFREDWKETPAEIPLHQGHVSNPDLIISLYGPGKDSLKKSHHDAPPDDPYYIWSGLCTGNWAVTLRHKTLHHDLSGLSRIIWRSRQSGLRELHIILKLGNGKWLVSKQGDDASGDWRVREFNLMDLQWYTVDMESITELQMEPDPDLSEVVEIGFTDLMSGGQSNACSRLDWIEVYGYNIH